MTTTDPQRAMRLLAVVVLLATAIVFASVFESNPLLAQEAPAFLVIVNPSNPVTELPRAEIRDLFLKRRAAWRSALSAAPVDLAPKFSVRNSFSHEILRLSPAAVTTYWMQEIFSGRGAPPPVMSSVSAAVAYVAENPGAIGYVPSDTPLDGVRAITVLP